MNKSMLDLFRGPQAAADPFASMRTDLDRMFEQMRTPWGVDLTSGLGADIAPSIEIQAKDDHIEVTAELPGVDEKDVEIELHDDLLTLKGEKKTEREEKDEEKGRVFSERSYGAFARTVRLPFAPEADKVKASFDKGVLKIAAPKPPELAPKSKRIAIG